MTTQPSPNVVDAAEAHLRDVRRKIGAGDPDVTVDDLDRAERAVRFAVTQREESATWAAEQAAQAQQERIARLCAELERHVGDPAVEKATRHLEKALDAYAATVKRHNERRHDIYDELSRIGELPPQVSLTPGSGDITVNGVVTRAPSAHSTIAHLATEALRRHFPRQQINLNRE